MLEFNELLIIGGMALVTMLVRIPVLTFFGKLHLPGLVLKALHYVPASVLTAIIVPSVLMPDGGPLQIGLDNAYLVASLVAILVALRTRNLLLTILLGMLALWGWRALIGG
jgi:branched-subunit amino acid transport protein